MPRAKDFGSVPGIRVPARLDRLFPKGRLPEEQSRNGPPLPWPYQANPPKPPDGLFFALADLVQLESDAARQLASKGTEPASIQHRLEDWLTDHLTEEGFYYPNPWATASILPALARLRIVLGPRGWKKEWDQRLQQVLHAVFRLSTASGFLFRPQEGYSKGFRELLVYLADQRLLSGWTHLLRWVYGVGEAPKRNKTIHPGIACERSGIAVLRRDWSKSASAVAVDFRTSELRLELRLGDHLLTAGTWGTRLQADGVTVPMEDSWSLLCTLQDEDGEYLELSNQPREDLLIERQIFVARQMGLVFLADTIRSTEPARLECSWELGLRSAGSNFVTADPTLPEVVSHNQLPLRPIWLTLAGKVETHGEDLRFEHACEGTILFRPVFFVWSEEKQSLAPKWKQLTITADRRLLQPDDAQAYRVTLGDRKLLVFRSFEKGTRKAFLGYQTFNESLLGEFLGDGSVDEWMLIE